jgi:hypothetical protein
MQALETARLETAGRWEQDGGATGEMREIIGAVDETFFEQMILIFQDGATGDIVQEEVAAERTYATWQVVVEARLTALGTAVFYLVSDRAKALLQLAAQGLECLRMPDCFHGMHANSKSSGLAIGRRVRHAHQKLQQAEEALARRHARGNVVPDRREAQAEVEAKRAEVKRWEEVQRAYRQQLETRSRSRHPLRMADAVPQTSAQVASHLPGAVEAIEV